MLFLASVPLLVLCPPPGLPFLVLVHPHSPFKAQLFIPSYSPVPAGLGTLRPPFLHSVLTPSAPIHHKNFFSYNFSFSVQNYLQLARSGGSLVTIERETTGQLFLIVQGKSSSQRFRSSLGLAFTGMSCYVWGICMCQ